MSCDTPMVHVDNWSPAGAISPLQGETVEFESKSTGRVHRGTFIGAAYLDADDGAAYPVRMIKRWRYVVPSDAIERR